MDQVGVLKAGAFVIVSFICQRIKKARVLYPEQGYIKIEALTETTETIGSLLKRSPRRRPFLRKPQSDRSPSPASALGQSPTPPSSSAQTISTESSDTTGFNGFDSCSSDSEPEDDEKRSGGARPPALRIPSRSDCDKLEFDAHRLALETLHDYLWEFSVDFAFEVSLDIYYSMKDHQKRFRWMMTLELVNSITDEAVMEAIRSWGMEAYRDLCAEERERRKKEKARLAAEEARKQQEEAELRRLAKEAEKARELLRQEEERDQQAVKNGNNSPREVADICAVMELKKIIMASEEAAKRKKKRERKHKRAGMCGFRVKVLRGTHGGKLGHVDVSKGSSWIIILDDGLEVVEPATNIQYLF